MAAETKPADEGQRGPVNLGAMGFAVTGIITVLGGFALTGTPGRVLRNEPEALAWAFVFVVVGAALLAAAALPLTEGVWESAFSAAGIVLTMGGVIVAVIAGVRTADDAERPAVTAQVDEATLRVKGNVKVSNLRSDARLVVLVDGLVAIPDGSRYTPTNVHQVYVGPDSDGKVDLPLDVRVPPGRFDAVGIKAWTSEGGAPNDDEDEANSAEDRPCAEYPRRVSRPRYANVQSSVGTGCMVLGLPPVPVSPQLAMRWEGVGKNEKRIRLLVKSDNAPVRLRAIDSMCAHDQSTALPCSPDDGGSVRVAVQVKSKRGGKRRYLYRALLRPDANGDLRALVRVPVHTRRGRICAEAAFVTLSEGFPSTECPIFENEAGRAAVELRPIRLP